MPEKRVLYYSRTDSVDAVEAAQRRCQRGDRRDDQDLRLLALGVVVKPLTLQYRSEKSVAILAFRNHVDRQCLNAAPAPHRLALSNSTVGELNLAW